MRSQPFLLAAICGASFCGAAGLAHAAVVASMEVHAIVDRTDGKPAEFRVDDGGVLRSGDRLQARVRAPSDGYIYVIAYGSSGSALLLHPFSGHAAEARVRADQEMVVPAPGIYLPLDGHPGQETLFAVWSESPLQGISSVLVRMEGARGDAVRAEQILRDVFPDLQRVSFRHLDKTPLLGVDLVSTGMAMQYRATGTIAPLQESGSAVPQSRTDPYAITSTVPEPTPASGVPGATPSTADPLLQPSGMPLSGSGQDLDALLPLPQEEEVLGGVGSKLRAFESGTVPAVVPAAPVPGPPAPTQFIGPGAPQSSAPPEAAGVLVAPTPPPRSSANAAGGGITAAIAGLFGLDSASSTPGPEVVEPPRETGNMPSVDSGAARVLPLGQSDAESSIGTPPASAGTALSVRSASGEVDSMAMTVPGPVTTQPVAEAPAAEPAAPPTPPAISTSRIVDAGSLPDASGPVVQAPDPSEFMLAPAPRPEPQSKPPGGPTDAAADPSKPAGIGLFGALATLFSSESPGTAPAGVGESMVTPVEAPAVVSTVESPVLRTTPTPAEAPPVLGAVEGAAVSPPAAVSELKITASAPVSVVGSAVPPPTPSAAAEPPTPEVAPATSTTEAKEDDARKTSRGTLLGALGTLFSSSSTSGRSRRDGEQTSTASTDTAGADASVEPATVTATPTAAVAETAVRPVAAPPAPPLVAEVSPPAPPPVAEVSPPASNRDEASLGTVVQSEPDGDSGGGLFGRIGSLFRFGGSGATKADASGAESQAPEPVNTLPATPQPTQIATTPPATLRPAINLDEGVVVRIPGTEPPRKPGGEVLAEQGSRIRALLGEAPTQPSGGAPPAAVQQALAPAQAEAVPSTPAPSVATSVPQAAGTLSPAPSPVMPAPSPAVSPAPVAPVIAPAPTLTAAVAAPQSTVSVAPPLPGLGDASGGLPSTLPGLPTLSTEQSIAAARNVARGVVLVVTPEGSGSGALVDNSGHVLTNWHLVGAYGSVTVLVKDATGDLPLVGRPIRARVVRFSKFADLALLEMDTVPESVAPLVLGDSSHLHEGNMLHAIGHPDGGTWTHTAVIVTRVKGAGSWYSGRSFLHKADLVSGQAPTDPGANGAALLDSEMRLVAMSAQTTRRGDKVEAVSVETIRDFLSGNSAGLAGGG